MEKKLTGCKVIAGLIVFLVISWSSAFAEVIYSSQCQGGGNVSMDLASYTPETGYFSLTIYLNNCVEGSTILNGQMHSEGRLIFPSETEAALDYSTQIQMTQTKSGEPFQMQCINELSGLYNMSTGVFTGADSVTCNGSGRPDLIQALSGLIIYPYH